jgi:hypothetical protein
VVISEAKLRMLIREELAGWITPMEIRSQSHLGPVKVKLTAKTAPGQAEVGIGDRFSLQLTTHDLAKLRDFVWEVIADVERLDKLELKQVRQHGGDFWRPQRAA